MIGEIRFHREMRAEGIRPRDALVWLPPGYDEDRDLRYPVLYMQDGQNVFDPETSFIGVSWQADEVAGRLMREGRIRNAIIVAVYNTEDREEEYGDTARGQAYMRFMVHGLKPFIDRTYRTIPERNTTSVMGSSMGGLISFLLAWNHPDIFSQAACLSPAFLLGGSNIIPVVRDFRGLRKTLRLYIDNGSEGLDRELQRGCDEMVAALLEQGFTPGQDLEWFHDDGGEHSETSWSRRLRHPLVCLLGRPRLPIAA
jgi:predicted alpha/beta superfamily hydrolase